MSSPKPAFDLVLRLLHWTVALCILAMVASSQLAELFEHGALEDTIWTLHVWAGYALAGALGLRLAWGLAGPASARWSDFWHPAAWRSLVRERRLPTPRHDGHDPLASLAFLALYAVLAGLLASGLALAASEFAMGPLVGAIAYESLGHWVEELHEFGFSLVLGLVGLHLAALVWHQLRGEPVAKAMLFGKRGGQA